MSGPKLIGYRGTPISRDLIIPAVLDALKGVDCTVAGMEAPSLDVVITRGDTMYHLNIMAQIRALCDQVRADSVDAADAVKHVKVKKKKSDE